MAYWSPTYVFFHGLKYDSRCRQRQTYKNHRLRRVLRVQHQVKATHHRYQIQKTLNRHHQAQSHHKKRSCGCGCF